MADGQREVDLGIAYDVQEFVQYMSRVSGSGDSDVPPDEVT
jgi:hypothetical protein